jgi:hypothetical protein
MASNHDLISLYEQFWTTLQNKGYIKLVTKTSVIVARIASMTPATKSNYDRIVKLEEVDISGRKIPQTTFKLSDLVEAENVSLVIAKVKGL